MADTARVTMAAQESVAEEKAEAQAQKPGGIEVSLLHQGVPSSIKIYVDNDPEVSFAALYWSKQPVVPGLHTIHVTTAGGLGFKKVVNVRAGSVVRVEIKL